jgi:hypothetical protein
VGEVRFTAEVVDSTAEEAVDFTPAGAVDFTAVGVVTVAVTAR